MRAGSVGDEVRSSPIFSQMHEGCTPAMVAIRLAALSESGFWCLHASAAQPSSIQKNAPRRGAGAPAGLEDDPLRPEAPSGIQNWDDRSSWCNYYREETCS